MVARILIADDQEMILRALRTLLESQSNFKVCGTALNGSEAVIKARELRPDVIILDLAMPVMNGLEAAREIARIQPATPVLLYTMSDLPQVRLDAASAGIREVVGKSAAPHVLLDAVEKVFSTSLPLASDGVQSELPLAVTSTDVSRRGTEPQHPDASNQDGRKAS